MIVIVLKDLVLVLAVPSQFVLRALSVGTTEIELLDAILVLLGQLVHAILSASQFDDRVPSHCKVMEGL